ncbi:hypothetical protein ONZ45_g3728 [Pleurotus djamor]|nr:hypothetical protein ONZ45_g3728 [Pleurotus djamor]
MPARPVYSQRRTAYECPTLPLVPVVASPLLENYFSARIDASFIAMRRVCEERNQACSATRKLPSEVLAMIFSIVTTFPPPFQLISRSSPRKEIIPWISVTYVCRQWRTAALTTPSLWCDFKYAKGPWLELFLGRSGALPLTIKAFMNTDPLLAIAFNSPNRLGELELSSAAASDLSRLNKPTPYLTSLSLTGNVSIPDDLLGGGHTPSLQSFTMGYGSLIPMKPIWLLNTRRLTLERCWGLRDLSANRISMSSHSALEFLKPLEMLESLRIEFDFREDILLNRYLGPTVHFPYLRVVRVSFTPDTIDFISIFDHIEMPGLRELTVELPDLNVAPTQILDYILAFFLNTTGLPLSKLRWDGWGKSPRVSLTSANEEYTLSLRMSPPED